MAGVSAEQRGQVVNSVAPVLPGVISLYWTLALVVNGVLGQNFRGTFPLNFRPSPDFTTLALPRWLPSAAAATDRGVVMPVRLGSMRERSNPFVAAVFLVGLAVVHVAAKRSGGIDAADRFLRHDDDVRWPVVLVAFIGLIEQLAGFRQRMATPARRSKWKLFYWNELNGSARWAMSQRCRAMPGNYLLPNVCVASNEREFGALRSRTPTAGSG